MAFNVLGLDTPCFLSMAMAIGDLHRRLRYTWLTTGIDVGQIDLANALSGAATDCAG
nr:MULTISPECIES: hypothetical protein [Pseudomonas]